MMTAAARFDQAMVLNRLALKMKNRGWAVDQTAVVEHQGRLANEIVEAKEKFQQVAGIKMRLPGEAEGEEDDDTFDESFFSSAPQLKELFFNKWGVRPKYFSKNTGAPSLDRNALKDLLAEGATQQIKDASRWLLRFREAHKTKATYIDRLRPDAVRTTRKLREDHLRHEGAHSDNCYQIIQHPNTLLTQGYPEPMEWRLRPTWNVVQALTARWSSSDPNLQNLQKTRKNPQTKQIERLGTRNVLVARPGFYLVEGDYSQLELRIICLLAGDEILLEMYNDPTVDMHAENAKVLFELDHYDPIAHKNLRDLAKNFVYGANYGGSAKTLWKALVVGAPNITQHQVAEMQERWFKVHPWLLAFSRGKYQDARRLGRVIEEISGREFIFYMGQVKLTEPANYTVQGFAAALMNAACVRIDRALDWEDDESMLAQVHDASFLEGRKPRRLGRILQENMPSEIEFGGHRMRFGIDLKGGTCWGTLEEWKDFVAKLPPEVE